MGPTQSWHMRRGKRSPGPGTPPGTWPPALFLLFAPPDGNLLDSSLMLNSSSQPQGLPLAPASAWNPLSPSSFQSPFTWLQRLLSQEDCPGQGRVSSLLSAPEALALSEPLHSPYFIAFFFLVCLLIFGCTGSSLLCAGFL